MDNWKIPEGWYPMSLQLGPPLPRSMQVYWPWVTPPALPEGEVPAPPWVPPIPPWVEKYRLYVYTVGNGTVTPTDGEYAAGSVVTLTARPEDGAAFDHWAGDASGTNPMVNVLMDRSKSATAYFKAVTPPPYDEEPPPEEIPPVPPEVPPADIKDFDFKLTKGTYDAGARVPFTAPYDYKGIAQDGQLTISIGTGVSPTFNPVFTYEPIPVTFEEAADWQTRGLDGHITLPNILEPEQTYSVRAKLETLTIRTQETDTDWSAFDIKAIAKPKFYMPAQMEVKVSDGSILDMYWQCEFRCPITNKGTAEGTHTITAKDSLGQSWSRRITLAPGQTHVVVLTRPGQKGWYIDFRRISPPYVWEITGDWEGDNYSRGEARP